METMIDREKIINNIANRLKKATDKQLRTIFSVVYEIVK